MSKINLVPESKQQVKKIQKINLVTTISVITIISLLLIAVLILQGIKIAKNSSKNTLAKSIEKTNKELGKYEDLEKTVLSLQSGLDGSKKIICSNIKWTLFFAELEKATPKDISFKDMDIKEGLIRASVEGKNIDSLSRFIDAFESYKIKTKTGDSKCGDTIVNSDSQSQESEANLFKNIDVSGYTKDNSGQINFSVTMELVREVLWP